MKVLGIIQARSGSKRVANKNIRLLNGKPLIQYTIEAANGSSKLEKFIVSTNSKEIADLAKAIGAEVPFIRPVEIAEDSTPDRPVLIHAIQWLKKNENYTPDAIALLRPTSPFKTPEIIDNAIKLLNDTGADSVRTVTKVQGVHHPYWMYIKGKKNKAETLLPDFKIGNYYQSQLLPPVFRLNGCVDIIKAEIILNGSLPLYGNDMRIFEIPEELSMDIDTELDLEICEMLMRRKVNST